MVPSDVKRCRTCNTRRIKCDGQKPQCQKCSKAGRKCVYKPENGQFMGVIHSENRYASGQTRRPRGPRSAVHLEEQKQVILSPRPPIMDLTTKALMYYAKNHLRTEPNVPGFCESVIDYILPSLQSLNNCPVTEMAYSTMALGTFAKTQQLPQAAIDASAKYQQLLRRARFGIGPLAARAIDASLLAIFFMSRYENIIFTPCQPRVIPGTHAKLPSFSHDDGAMAILRLWKTEHASGRPASNIVKQVRRGSIRSTLLRNNPVPSWMQDGFPFGERGLELEFDHLTVQVANVRHRIIALTEERISPASEIEERASEKEELQKTAHSIDEALEAWTLKFPQSWGYNVLTLPEPHPWPLRDFYSPTVYGFSDSSYAAAWTYYFAIRMLLICGQIRLLESCTAKTVDSNLFERYAKLNELADELACSIPFALNKFKIVPDSGRNGEKKIVLNLWEEVSPYRASMIMWPLSLAACLVRLQTDQRAWFRRELAYLGKASGVGLMESAETGPWLEL